MKPGKKAANYKRRNSNVKEICRFSTLLIVKKGKLTHQGGISFCVHIS